MWCWFFSACVSERVHFPCSPTEGPIHHSTNVSRRTETTSNYMHTKLYLLARLKSARGWSIFSLCLFLKLLSLYLFIHFANPLFSVKVDIMVFGQNTEWGKLFVAHYHREIMFSGFSGCVMLSWKSFLRLLDINSLLEITYLKSPRHRAVHISSFLGSKYVPFTVPSWPMLVYSITSLEFSVEICPPTKMPSIVALKTGKSHSRVSLVDVYGLRVFFITHIFCVTGS